MDTSELHNEFNKFNSELEAITKTFQAKMQAVFTDMMKQFFIETPRCQAIVWTQYTPYFNDGEECTFSVNDIYFVEKGFDPENLLDAYDYEYSDYDAETGEGILSIKINADPSLAKRYRELAEQYKSHPENSKYYAERAAEIEEAIANDDGTVARCAMVSNVISQNEGLMQDLFGDHVSVYVTAEESMTQEYSHE